MIEPHGIEWLLPLLRRTGLPQYVIETLLREKAAKCDGKRYVIREIARLRPFTPGKRQKLR